MSERVARDGLPLSGAGSRRRRNFGPQPAAELVARHSKSGITVMPWLARRWRGCRVARLANTRVQTLALLKGLIFGPTGAAMSPTHTRKGNRLYRYCVSQDVLRRGPDACPVGRVPAAEIEAVVIDQLRGIFRQPGTLVGTWRAARAEQDDVTEDEVRDALTQLAPLWDELFPAEQARIVQLLVERVDVRMHGVEVRLRPNGLAGLVREVAGNRRAAA